MAVSGTSTLPKGADMLEAVRITLAAYTASFRVPSFLSYQLTLSVPPISTIFGLLSAAAGRWVLPDDVPWLAYRCTYQARARDLEAIVTVQRDNADASARFTGRNVIQREFLIEPRLTLYLPPDWAELFRRPRHTLVLGRTQDVATVESLSSITLWPVDSGTLSGVLLPFDLVARESVGAVLHNLPIAFTPDPDRAPIGMQIFGVVDGHRVVALRDAGAWLYRDHQTEIVVPLFRREWMRDASPRAAGEIE